MMRGERQRAPVVAGAFKISTSVTDTYAVRRRWSDWLRDHAKGPCLILEHEGTRIRQELYFADFAEALAFILRWGCDAVELMTGDAVWTDIIRDGCRFSPCVFIRDWPYASVTT